MSGKSQSTQNTSTQQQTTPWDVAQPGLTAAINQLTPLASSAGGNPYTQSAYNQLYENAEDGNPYAPGVGAATAGQIGGAQNYGQATGILGNAYANLQGQLSPFTSGNPYDPSTNPALRQQLDTLNADVSGQVNPLFAAAGRLASPSNAQALARGIAQGSTGILQNAATNRLNASNALFGAGGNTASGLLASDTANANIQNSGINNMNTALQAPNWGPLQTLGIAQQQQSTPVQNLAQITSILGPLAGMFGQQTGSSASTGTQTMSPAQQAWGWINAFSGLGNASKSGGSSGSFPFSFGGAGGAGGGGGY